MCTAVYVWVHVVGAPIYVTLCVSACVCICMTVCVSTCLWCVTIDSPCVHMCICIYEGEACEGVHQLVRVCIYAFTCFCKFAYPSIMV